MKAFFKTYAFSLIFFIWCHYTAQAQQFTELTINQDKQNTFEYVHWFDHNGDGLIDLVFERDDCIYLNNGDKTFTQSGPVIPETGYVWTLTDLDKSGTIDFISSIGISNVYVLYNRPDGSFQSSSLPVDPGSSYYQWIDIDGDSDLDYIYSSTYLPREPFSNKLWAYINDNGQFNRQEHFDYAIHFKANDRVYMTDMDKDGDFDMLVSNHDEEGPLRVYSCVDPYKFVLDSIYDLPEGYNGRIYLTDINNDGYEDFMHANAYGTQIFTNNHGEFTMSPQAFNYAWINYADWGDFDNDGYQDFIFSRCSGGSCHVTIHKNNQDGTFSETPFISQNYEQIRPKWIDIDNDGYLDLSIENYRCSYWESYCGQPYHIQFFINDGGSIPNQAPGIPENVHLDIASDRLIWDPPSGDETPQDALQYNIHLNSGSQTILYPMANLQSGTPLIISDGNTRTNQFIDTKYMKAGSYTARVQSRDGGKKHSSFSNAYNFIIYEAPQNLILEQLKVGEVTLSWQNSVLYDELIIERSCDGQSFKEIDTISGTNESYTDIATGIICSNLSYRIKGKLVDKTSAYSDVLDIDIRRFSDKHFNFESTFWNAYDIVWSDIDLDGDLDAAAFQYPQILIYRNDQFGNYSLIQSLENPGRLFPSLDWVDTNQDNIPDLKAHFYDEGVFFFRNDGTGFFTLENAESPLPPMSELCDIDCDGTQEVLYVDEQFLYFSELDSLDPVLLYDLGNEYEERFRIYVQDLNADGWLDIYLFSKNSKYLKSTGPLRYEEIQLPHHLDPIEELYNQQGINEGDINGNGKPDLIFNYITTSDHIVHTGFMDLDESENFPLTNISGQPQYNTTVFGADIDNNGETDILLKRGFVDELNEETAPVLYLQEQGQFDYHHIIDHMDVRDLFEIIDYDQDGDLDILCNGLEEESWTFIGMLIENKTSDLYGEANQPPAPPTEIQIKYDSTAIQINWNQGMDAHSDPATLTYSFYLQKDDEFVISPLAEKTTGFRRILKPGNHGTNRTLHFQDLKAGNYHFAVQSVDNGFLGSEFSTSSPFRIAPVPVLEELQQLNSTTVKLRWSVENNPSGFVIKRSLHPRGPYETIAKLAGNTMEYTDLALDRNTTYYYQIHYHGEGLLSESLKIEYYNSDFIELYNPLLPSEGVYKSVTCDVDQDGDFDLALLMYDHVEIFENDGNGLYAKAMQFDLIQAEPIDILVTDLNNDNRIDFAIYSWGQEGLTIAIQTESSTFSVSELTISSYQKPVKLIAADFNNDGRRDILYGNLIFFMIDDHFESIQFLDYDNLINNDQSSISPIDLDLDQDIDIVFGGRPSWVSNIQPTPSTKNTICYECGSIRYILEDFNGDGMWDFFVLGTQDYPSKEASFLWNTGDMNFETAPLIEMKYTSVNTVTADFDNNGFPDVLASGIRNYPYVDAENYAYINKGNKDIQETKIMDFNTNISDLQLADIDQDGDLDLLVSAKGVFGIKTFLNTTNHLEVGLQNTRPQAPDNVQVTALVDSIHISWDPGSDTESSHQSLTYNIQIKDASGAYILSTMSNDYGSFLNTRHGNAGLNTSWKIYDLPPGDYSCMVQAIDPGLLFSKFSTEKTFTVPEPVLTGLSTTDLSVSIYPNPVDDFMHLDLTSPCKNLQITDLAGRLMIVENQSTHQPGYLNTSLDLKSLPGGIYILNFETEDEQHAIRFVKK